MGIGCLDFVGFFLSFCCLFGVVCLIGRQEKTLEDFTKKKIKCFAEFLLSATALSTWSSLYNS